MWSSQQNDVIVAIATPPGRGALGVVRLSGAGALEVVRRIFFATNGKAGKMRPHRMEYGNIRMDGTVIDEVMLCAMPAPKSFTREDVVEIFAHGGPMTMQGVLNAALQSGARLARPGEFTQRAFLNGRINLAQAEAVMDLIHAGSEAARAAGLRQLGGGLSSRISICRNAILRWLAHISLSIDYPEHEEEATNRATILSEGQRVLADMQALLQTANIGRLLREGIKTAIIGAPNAGKSTLLNALLGEDRAIIHELPGTTRDVLTESVQIHGIPLVLMDTAGLRETSDPVEKMGVERSRQAMDEAELILHVIDGSTTADSSVSADGQATQKKIITIINKSDLPEAAQTAQVIKKAAEASERKTPIIPISAKTGAGLDKLLDAIRKTIFNASTNGNTATAGFVATPTANKNNPPPDFLVIQDFAETDVITRERHRVLLVEAIEFLQQALAELEAGVAEDMVAIALRGAYLSLGHILGEEYADDIIDRIFAEFCVGK
ncbi:MAG: tRNA uridine-5-carboxymethylaminomethyl(34) synthesis GTPase MnmE [Defluviitaleaceae bacterium]|nr:tRNA uridine-5-carboxymethylaminomethyl(34) synthesis GTPase MnmE [Defluviitaleaceae bacterium]